MIMPRIEDYFLVWLRQYKLIVIFYWVCYFLFIIYDISVIICNFVLKYQSL